MQTVDRFTPMGHAHRHRHRLAVVLGAIAGSITFGAPLALADGWTELEALADCDSTAGAVTVTLDADVNQADDGIDVTCDAVIDLNGYTVAVDHINVVAPAALTIDDTSAGANGQLNALAGPTVLQAGMQAGIGVPLGASLVVKNGHVQAQGGEHAAAIGGEPATAGADAGTVTISGGSVTASGGLSAAAIGAGANGHDGGTVTIDGGTVDVLAYDGRAFGHGVCGALLDGTGKLIIGTGVDVTATVKDPGAGRCSVSPLGLGGTAPFLVVGGTLRIDYGGPIHLPHGGATASAVVDEGGLIAGPTGSPADGPGFTGPGTIDNHGTIAFFDGSVEVGVTDHSFLHTFTFTAPRPDPVPPLPIRVFAPTYTDGYRPVIEPSDGYGWAVQQPGPQRWWDPSEPLTGDVVLHELTKDIEIAIAQPGDVAIGSSVDIDAVVNDRFGPVEPQPALRYESSGGSDSFAGNTLTPVGVGKRTITVTEPVTGVTASIDVTVTGPLGWTELEELVKCASGGPVHVALDADIDYSDGTLVVGCDVTIDLNAKTLTVDHIDITPGSKLTVDDTSAGARGRLVAAARSNEAGIGVPPTATLVVRNGNVRATGGSYAAGIGGDQHQTPAGPHAGRVEIWDGTVVAAGRYGGAGIGGAYSRGNGGTVEIHGGTVTASGSITEPFSIGGAGIGGGSGGAGSDVSITGGTVTATGFLAPGFGHGCDAVSTPSAGTLAIGEGAIVTASSLTRGQCASAPIALGAQPGSVIVNGTLRLDRGSPVSVPEAGGRASLTIGAHGVVSGLAGNETTGPGFTGPGAIDNGGIIAFTEALVQVDVLDHNFLHTFTTAQGATTDIRVFAPSFATGYRTQPATTVTDARWVVEDGDNDHWWNPAAELVGDVDLYEAVPAFELRVEAPGPITAGVPVPIVAIVHDGVGPLDPQPELLLTGPAEAGLEFDGHRLTATGAGTWTITITDADHGLEQSIDVTVVAAAAAVVEISPPQATVRRDESLEFTVSAWDRFENPIDVTGVELTSSAPDDVDGRMVTFTSLGVREITAELDGETAIATVTVVAAGTHSIQIDAPATMVAGSTVTVAAVGLDDGGEPLADQPVFEFESDQGRDSFDGPALSAYTAGRRTITVTDPGTGVHAAVEITVLAAEASQLELSAPTLTVPQGGSVTFTVAAADPYGNAVDPSGARLESSVATDEIDGLTVTFPHASPHVVTARLAGATASVVIEVTPDPTPAPPTTPAPAPPTTPAPAPPTTPAPTPPSITPELPETGGRPAAVSVVAMWAVALGASALLLSRRSMRRS